MRASILVDDVDFELLYQQRDVLLAMLDYPLDPRTEQLEGLVNLLDHMLDKAEEEGYFTFPEREIEK
jgi:hypothetical protein